MKQIIFITLIFIFLCSSSSSQTAFDSQLKLKNNSADKSKLKKADSPMFALSVFLIIVTVNPIIEYEDKKIHFGITRELTLGFGKNSPVRLSFEYSYIFKSGDRSRFRASAKYDFLSKLSHSEWISTRWFASIGGGYFRDKTGEGVFPEFSAGFRVGDSNFIFQPYAKLRHTFMLTKDKPGITDFSIGAIIGHSFF